VLWLNVPHALARERLRAFAQRRGIAAGRVVFAGFAKQAEHLARLRCADLALDVLPYGSHTTGSDALWCGVPLLTVAGASFAGRVGTSLVRAAGLPAFAAGSFAEYRARLDALCANRAELAAAREHLERERGDLPLFDTPRFTRDFEALLERAADGG
jgi:predicted O-linked N-acetylglucosamine transferase (SPINDLY family)